MTHIRALAIVGAVMLAGAVHAQEPIRRLYVSAIDEKGAPVTGLAIDDFSVKEGGRARTLAAADRTDEPMQIAILVDDNGSGLFRVGVGRFIQSLLGRAQFSISMIRGQAVKLVDYTADTDALVVAIGRLGVRPAANDGNLLLDAITSTSLDMVKRKAKRPIIIAMTVGGDDVTPVEPDDALDDLRKSGAQLYVISVIGSSQRPTVTPTRPSDMMNEGKALHVMLGDGPRRSGGYRQEILAMAGVDTGLLRLAEQLKSQYQLEYSLDGAKPSDRVAVTSRRKEVVVRAPTHVPTKF